VRTLRVALADDEAAARRALRRALDGVEGVLVVGEADNGAAALDLARSERPDLMFLDIRMPGASGLEVAAALRAEGGPAVVFVTAFDAHAVEAFEHAALDYVLKPVDPARVAESVRRVRAHGAPRLADVDPAGLEALAAGRTDAALLRVAGRLQVVEHAGVRYVEAAGNYVRVHGAGRTWLVRGTIANVVERLGGGLVRVHRSYAVRLAEVAEVLRPDGNDPSARLRGGDEVPIGRTYWRELKGLLGG
jgi:two-component system LytT family response regulator